MSQSGAAKELGVSRQAVSKHLQELRGKTTKVVAAKKVERIVDNKIDSMEQLGKINEHAVTFQSRYPILFHNSCHRSPPKITE